MQSWVTRLVGAAAVVFAIWLVAHNFHAPKAIGHDASPASTGTTEGGGGVLYALGDAGAAAVDDAGAPLLLTDLLEREPRMDGGAGGVMPDGSPVPLLPMSAPRQVRFGVVLVSYAGAQPSAVPGSRPVARSKADAKALADKLFATAKQDFHAAVQQGDAGSADDIGTVKVGLLEPAPEYVLFTLPVDSVGGPVDTPRGYWIVKRLQ